MSRIVLAVALLFLGAEAAHADDDFKTCASGPPDYAIMACTNLIEGGKLDARDQSVAYTNRAVAFRKRGGLNRALADLNRALEQDPKHYRALEQLGQAYDALGKKPEALEAYRKALAINPFLSDAEQSVRFLEKEIGARNL